MPRQNRGSDSELSYASLAYSFEKGDSIIVQENCRSRGSSDDNEDITFLENFINEDYRAGGPAMAPHPVESYALPSYATMKAIEQHPYRTNIYNKLNNWGLEIKEYGVMLRQSKDFPEDGRIPTLVIISQKTKRDQSWLNASLEIRNYLVSQGFPEVSVGIADKKAFRSIIISPVERTEDGETSEWSWISRYGMREEKAKEKDRRDYRKNLDQGGQNMEKEGRTGKLDERKMMC